MTRVRKSAPCKADVGGRPPECDSAGGTTMVDLAPDGLPFIPVLGEARYASIGKESHLHVHPVLTDRFRRLTGLPPHQFVVSCRIERAKEALERTDSPVWRIAGDAGYATAAHFVCVFRRETGMTPALWRKHHAH